MGVARTTHSSAVSLGSYNQKRRLECEVTILVTYIQLHLRTTFHQKG